MCTFVPETTTTMKTTEGKTKDTKIHSDIIIAVVVTIGFIILAGSVVTFFIRTSTFKNMNEYHSDYPDTKGNHPNDFEAAVSTKHADMPMQNINGLHPELRAEDQKFYVEHPNVRQQCSELYQGTLEPEQNININGLHPELRAEDQIFYVEHPNVKQQGSELYQGTPDPTIA